jgi:elongation factor Ts
MAEITMELVKELRERTQAGLGDCKKALVETGGEVEKAIELLMKWGVARSAKRAGAIAAEGEVVARVADDGRSGVLVEVNIQTDFAARNADFRRFARSVADVAMRARDGADLGAEPHPDGGSVEERRQALVGRLGENVSVRRWARLSVGGPGRVVSYVHMDGKIGVLVALRTGSDEAAARPELGKLAEDVAMQVAAMDPQWLSAAQVPEAAKQKQTEIILGQMAEDPRPPPEAKRPQIAQGKLAKWLKEVCLLEQQSVIEADRSVDRVRADVARALGADVTIERFVRFARGEGIERTTSDLASEVAKLSR